MAPGEDDVRVVASARGTGRGRGPSTGLTVAVVVALLAGLLIGRLTAGGDDDGKSSPQGGAGSGPGPARSVDGVPTGYARTREGAVAAATNYLTVLSSDAVLNNGRRDAAIRAMADSSFAPRFLRQTAAANAQLERGPLGAGLRGGAPTVFQAGQLGYRIDSYNADAAIVSIWNVALIGNATSVAPQVAWQTNTFRLRWAGDWKLAGYRGEQGPTPALPRGTAPTPPTGFVQRAGTFKGFRYAP